VWLQGVIRSSANDQGWVEFGRSSTWEFWSATHENSDSKITAESFELQIHDLPAFYDTYHHVCCIQTVIDLCISCVLITFNKDDDDDDRQIHKSCIIMCIRVRYLCLVSPSGAYAITTLDNLFLSSSLKQLPVSVKTMRIRKNQYVYEIADW